MYIHIYIKVGHKRRTIVDWVRPLEWHRYYGNGINTGYQAQLVTSNNSRLETRRLTCLFLTSECFVENFVDLFVELVGLTCYCYCICAPPQNNCYLYCYWRGVNPKDFFLFCCCIFVFIRYTNLLISTKPFAFIPPGCSKQLWGNQTPNKIYFHRQGSLNGRHCLVSHLNYQLRLAQFHQLRKCRQY